NSMDPAKVDRRQEEPQSTEPKLFALDDSVEYAAWVFSELVNLEAESLLQVFSNETLKKGLINKLKKNILNSFSHIINPDFTVDEKKIFVFHCEPGLRVLNKICDSQSLFPEDLVEASKVIRIASSLAELSCLKVAPNCVADVADTQGSIQLPLLKRAVRELDAEIKFLSLISGVPPFNPDARIFPSDDLLLKGLMANIADGRFVGDTLSLDFKLKFISVKPLFALLPEPESSEAIRDVYRVLSSVQVFRKFTSRLTDEISERLQSGSKPTFCGSGASSNLVLNTRADISREMFMDENSCFNALQAMADVELSVIRGMRKKLKNMGPGFNVIAHFLGLYAIDDERSESKENSQSNSEVYSILKFALKIQARNTAKLLFS
ncbi:MAG: hypothetical protein KDD56_08445, partial [Bdellovibrionales bacterium]|nr:hypothetical protein [Bdellovibrionales bacterium]